MLYPLKFRPILKEKIWGGNKIKTLFNKQTDKENIGESWEISTINGCVSVVLNGKFEGENLVDLIKEHKGKLLGEKLYKEFGNQFPLLIKFIDANQDLSVQLHPNDKLAKERHNSFGKTEMWYVVQADKNAKLIVGFNKNTSKEEYESYLQGNKITELLNFENTSKGDSYFINAGRIHAIGSGCLIAEIQQVSDVTYRIYDWNRKDSNGNKRELHTCLALDALNFDFKNDFKINYNKLTNIPNNLVSCKYFTTNFFKINNSLIRSYLNLDSFVVFMCVKGKGKICFRGFENDINLGETVLVPATCKKIELKGNHLEILEIYLE